MMSLGQVYNGTLRHKIASKEITNKYLPHTFLNARALEQIPFCTTAECPGGSLTIAVKSVYTVGRCRYRFMFSGFTVDRVCGFIGIFYGLGFGLFNKTL